MRRVGMVIILIVSFILAYKAFQIWQQAGVLEYKNIQLQKEIRDLQKDLELWKFFPEQEIGLIESNYKGLDEQIRFITRMHQLRTSLALDNFKLNEPILSAARSSPWLGIKQIVLHVKFYDLKETGQYLRILQCLKILEESNPLRIINIVQSVNQLEVVVQLYGREI